jgi:uncharacterized protein (TIGR02285 family)
MIKGALAVLALLSSPVLASERPVITWLMADLPPNHIEDGPYAGQGIKDKQLAFLKERLPQFQHHALVASVARMWYEMPRNDGNCIIGVYHTAEREAFTRFSARPAQIDGYRLIFRRDRAPRIANYLTAEGTVDLATLGNRNDLNGGYLHGSVYVPLIRNFIDDAARVGRLDHYPTTTRMFNLLLAGRIDYVFAQPFEAAYFAEIEGHQAGNLQARPIARLASTADSYIACSDKPVGRAAIAAIDQILADDGNWRDFTAMLRAWTLN